jgi:hypothetical protein
MLFLCRRSIYSPLLHYREFLGIFSSTPACARAASRFGISFLFLLFPPTGEVGTRHKQSGLFLQFRRSPFAAKSACKIWYKGEEGGGHDGGKLLCCSCVEFVSDEARRAAGCGGLPAHPHPDQVRASQICWGSGGDLLSISFFGF